MAAGCFKFGFLFMAKMYIVPYWINVMWLDVVTYLHHTDKEVRAVSLVEFLGEPHRVNGDGFCVWRYKQQALLRRSRLTPNVATNRTFAGAASVRFCYER